MNIQRRKAMREIKCDVCGKHLGSSGWNLSLPIAIGDGTWFYRFIKLNDVCDDCRKEILQTVNNKIKEIRGQN